MDPSIQAPLPRYSRFEIERRWEVGAALSGDVRNAPFRVIEDLYLENTRLRLRKITDQRGDRVFKLGKKYGKQSWPYEPITTLYLTEEEYGAFANLPGHAAKKTRYAFSGGSLDVYQDPNRHFMLFELEFVSEEEARKYVPPSFVAEEITGDPSFSGWALAARWTHGKR